MDKGFPYKIFKLTTYLNKAGYEDVYNTILKSKSEEEIIEIYDQFFSNTRTFELIYF